MRPVPALTPSSLERAARRARSAREARLNGAPIRAFTP